MTQKRYNLLIVDDKPDFLTEIQQAFDFYPNNEFNIETAQSGEEGLTKLRTRRFDVVLIDLYMPSSSLSGLDMINRMNEESLYLGVAILTGHGGKEEAVKALNLGVQAWFDKPVVDSEMKFSALYRRLKELAQVIPKEKADEFFSFFDRKVA